MGKKISVIIVIFFAFSVAIFSQKIKSKAIKTATVPTKQTEKMLIKIKEAGSDRITLSLRGKANRQVLFLGKSLDSTLKAEKIEDFAPKDTISISGLKKIEGKWLVASVLDTQQREICINGLNAKEDYFILLYEKKGNTYRLARSIEFNTLAEEPTRPASKIATLTGEDGSIVLKWLRGSGEGRIVIGARGNKLNFPKDGESYNVGTKLGATRIFADLKGRETNLLLKNLEPGRWTIQIIEYNGDGKYRNYLLSPGDVNPGVVFVPLDPPKVNQPTATTEEGFTISWSAVEGAVSYLVEIATDDKFQNKLPEYTELDIGNTNEIELQGLNSKSRYYFRIKAKTKDNWSRWSKGVMIETK
ncbi:MAG: fibronectin type III domain-containing protein [Candidatus Kapaibacteriales bacterium]